MACSLYFISVYLVSKNFEILSNPMPQNQINGVDETANVSVGFDRNKYEVLRQRFQLFKVSYRAIISFYWIKIFID